MTKIEAVIVEDEKTAREVLKNYLRKYCPQVEIIGEAKNATEAIKVIDEAQPALVFLDVEMPFGNAFDVLEGCKNINFETIFVTAYSEYALQALNQSAAYYLLKPISIEELVEAVNKVQSNLEKEEMFNRNKVIVQNFKEKRPEKRQVILPTMNGFDIVKMDEIIRLKGNGNFTDIYLKNGSKRMVCRFLKHFEDLLPHPFIRVHRSHIINLDTVKSFQKGSKPFVVLEDDSEVEVSSSYKENLIASLI